MAMTRASANRNRTGSMAASAASCSANADGLAASGWRSSSSSRQCQRPSAS